jgi:SAM-dependent methyltransferase
MTAPQSPRSDDGSARLKLADALRAQDRQLEAVQVLLEGAWLHRSDFRFRFALAAALERFPLDSAGPEVREILLDLSRDENIATQCLADAAIGLTKSSPAFPRLLDASIAGRNLLSSDIPEISAAVNTFVREPLFLAILSRAVAVDPELERVLAHIRRCMLLHTDAETATFEFACALARQCFNTEYAIFAAQDEAETLLRLQQQVGSILGKAGPASPSTEKQLVLAALYAPLNRLPQWERMLQWLPESLSDAFRPIWLEQVIHYRQERDFASRIEALTPISHQVSQAVRSLYEENPYPRWITMLRPQVRSLADVLPDFRAREGDGTPHRGLILVAGCGTGQHPINTAMTFPDCEVVAVDLSRTSLAYAIRMARHFEVRNLSFFQADILEMGSFARRFDLIESFGVLHHLEDPLAGWRVLVGLLREGGTMRIGLYSTIARKPLRAAQDFVRQSGFPGTPEGIRDCRRAILELPEGHPARSVLASDDFYSASGCRDLIMHIQERTYTLPQIADCLRKLGLKFLGLQCPPEVKARFQARFRDPAALLDLASWDRFEALHPESFRGMYQFLCGRKN